MRTLITNGTIVTADGSYPADVLIDGEAIAGIGAGLAAMASATPSLTFGSFLPANVSRFIQMKSDMSCAISSASFWSLLVITSTVAPTSGTSA